MLPRLKKMTMQSNSPDEESTCEWPERKAVEGALACCHRGPYLL